MNQLVIINTAKRLYNYVYVNYIFNDLNCHIYLKKKKIEDEFEPMIISRRSEMKRK